jgi:hypothetical protein
MCAMCAMHLPLSMIFISDSHDVIIIFSCHAHGVGSVDDLSWSQLPLMSHSDVTPNFTERDRRWGHRHSASGFDPISSYLRSSDSKRTKELSPLGPLGPLRPLRPLCSRGSISVPFNSLPGPLGSANGLSPHHRLTGFNVLQELMVLFHNAINLLCKAGINRVINTPGWKSLNLINSPKCFPPVGSIESIHMQTQGFD